MHPNEKQARTLFNPLTVVIENLAFISECLRRPVRDVGVISPCVSKNKETEKE
jgi:hypothetical protein